MKDMMCVCHVLNKLIAHHILNRMCSDIGPYSRES